MSVIVQLEIHRSNEHGALTSRFINQTLKNANILLVPVEISIDFSKMAIMGSPPCNSYVSNQSRLPANVILSQK